MTITEDRTATAHVSLSGENLARVVGNALPFTGTDQTLPILTAVQLTLKDGVLTSAATDRYTLGSDSYKPVVESAVDRLGRGGGSSGEFAFIMRKADATELVRMAKAEKYAPITLTVDDDQLTVEVRGTSRTFKPEDGTFPDWRRLVAEREDEPIAVRAFNPKLVARFAKVQSNRNEPMRMHFAGDKPVRVRIGDTFVGLICIVRGSW